MIVRKFLVVTRGPGEQSVPALFYDELPTPTMLDRRPVVYKLELLGRWRNASLGEAWRAYIKHRDAGTLPPDNTDPKKRPRVRAQLAGEIVPFVGVSK